MSQSSISPMLRKNGKPKLSTSAKKTKSCVSKLPCEKEKRVNTLFRGVDSSNFLASQLEEYRTLEPEEYTQLEDEILNDGEEEEQLNKAYADSFQACYVSNMNQKNIRALNRIAKASKKEKLEIVLTKTQERFFAQEDMKANWARLFSVWLFERNEKTVDEFYLSSAQNWGLEAFLNFSGIQNVPEFNDANANDLGKWEKNYKGDTLLWRKKGYPQLVLNKNSLYIKDIMKRKPYRYAIKLITMAIERLTKEQRTLENIQKIIAEFMARKKRDKKFYFADYRFIGPMSATDEYNVLEWFLGSYTTTIKATAYNKDTGELSLNVVTENLSHWESATRFPEVIKGNAFMKYFNKPQYMYKNTLRDVHEYKKLDDKNQAYLIGTMLIPRSLEALAAGYVAHEKLNTDVVGTLKAASTGYRAKELAVLAQVAHTAHYFFGGNFVQTYEGDDVIVIKPPKEWIETTTIFFDRGSAIVDRFSKERLNVLIKEAQSLNITKLRLDILAHTDSKGSQAFNQALSADRAKSTKEYIGKYFELVEVNMEFYGEDYPADPYMQESAINRRAIVTCIEVKD